MDDATGEAEGSGLRVGFDRRLKLEFHGATVTSDAGLLAFRELDDAVGLTALAGDLLVDPRAGRNGRHTLLARRRPAAWGSIDVSRATRRSPTPPSGRRMDSTSPSGRTSVAPGPRRRRRSRRPRAPRSRRAHSAA